MGRNNVEDIGRWRYPGRWQVRARYWFDGWGHTPVRGAGTDQRFGRLYPQVRGIEYVIGRRGRVGRIYTGITVTAHPQSKGIEGAPTQGEVTSTDRTMLDGLTRRFAPVRNDHLPRRETFLMCWWFRWDQTDRQVGVPQLAWPFPMWLGPVVGGRLNPRWSSFVDLCRFGIPRGVTRRSDADFGDFWWLDVVALLALPVWFWFCGVRNFGGIDGDRAGRINLPY